jgi:hemerythrin superfamily protein
MSTEQMRGNGPEPTTGSAWADRSPDEIEREIENTRQRLSDTLVALESKLSPRERFNQAKESAVEMGHRVARATTHAITPDITTMIRMDHTHVLALFRRYRPATSLGRKRALVANACLALEIHATLEEEIFYPALEAVMAPDEVLAKSRPEHDQMRGLITQLRNGDPMNPGYDDTFRALMRAVLHHVADEETVLLPRAEELLGDELGELGARMTSRRMELLRPHLGEVATTTARSFPVATAMLATGVVALGWLLIRPGQRTHQL